MSVAAYGNNNWPVSLQAQQNQLDTNREQSWQNDDEELDRKAEIAERNAATNRKSIPPFVLKLSSFLDDESNADLIRWSDDGNSFVVLDEDEFARKLIPEMFKHNRYASFVRQLNMYGFHKKVGLSDNSMRASERKSKSPSEYSNPFFKRGRPKLLWLISKPKSSQPSKKAGQTAEGDDDEDVEAETPTGPVADRARARTSIVLPNGQRVLSQEQASKLQEELTMIRRTQALIQDEVKKLRDENEMMQNRAAAYQAIHQRHENSINAILTFLATVYRNQLEGRDAQQTLANMFSTVVPRDNQQGDRVVDLADHEARESSSTPAQQRLPRRQLLLEAPISNDTGVESPGRFTSVSTPTATDFARENSSAPPRSSRETPANIKSEPDEDPSPQNAQRSQNPQDLSTDMGQNDDILSFLNSTSNNGPGGSINRLDYPQALSQLQSANRKSPMSTPQRNSILQLMANGEARNALGGGTNNALISPSPPPIPGPSDPQWAARNKNIEELEHRMREQNDRFSTISNMLQPLSPSGSIPGLDSNVPQDFNWDLGNYSDILDGNPDMTNGVNFDGDGMFDFDQFDDNNNNVIGNNDANFGHNLQVDGAQDSQAASPANTVATIEDVPGENPEGTDSPRKRQRKI